MKNEAVDQTTNILAPAVVSEMKMSKGSQAAGGSRANSRDCYLTLSHPSQWTNMRPLCSESNLRPLIVLVQKKTNILETEKKPSLLLKQPLRTGSTYNLIERNLSPRS
ncbi:hypothetical protein WA026_009253 [Henosepilachna vigintioctopunctata]|uniref:Uncharacterized protein n=1 Tax=Henosepilachna vigintioctopunctata TaxID=420089 RepID=A0AAW1UZN3_9CUCU